jgi:hypothetical protein
VKAWDDMDVSCAFSVMLVAFVRIGKGVGVASIGAIVSGVVDGEVWAVGLRFVCDGRV